MLKRSWCTRLLVAMTAVITTVTTSLLFSPARGQGALESADTFGDGGLNLTKWSYLVGDYPTNSQFYVPTEVSEDGAGLHLHAEQPGHSP